MAMRIMGFGGGVVQLTLGNAGVFPSADSASPILGGAEINRVSVSAARSPLD